MDIPNEMLGIYFFLGTLDTAEQSNISRLKTSKSCSVKRLLFF